MRQCIFRNCYFWTIVHHWHVLVISTTAYRRYKRIQLHREPSGGLRWSNRNYIYMLCSDCIVSFYESTQICIIYAVYNGTHTCSIEWSLRWMLSSRKSSLFQEMHCPRNIGTSIQTPCPKSMIMGPFCWTMNVLYVLVIMKGNSILKN